MGQYIDYKTALYVSNLVRILEEAEAEFREEFFSKKEALDYVPEVVEVTFQYRDESGYGYGPEESEVKIKRDLFGEGSLSMYISDPGEMDEREEGA